MGVEGLGGGGGGNVAGVPVLQGMLEENKQRKLEGI